MLLGMRTPLRTFRPPPELWQDAKAIAASRGETLTDVLTEALRRYVRRHTPKETR